jgi:alpha/beta superfamily hydrolase
MFFSVDSEPIDDLNPRAVYKTKPTFILCNPNAMFYQHMINYPHAFYLRFFLSRGINVMLWNYRGYGRSHVDGWFAGNYPTPDNIREDVECVLEYLKNVMGLKGKFGVYGRSMGGIAACHLANTVDMIIVDRSFADLETVIFKKFSGLSALSLYQVVSSGWNSNNVESYLKGAYQDPDKTVLLAQATNKIIDISQIGNPF